MAKSAQLGLHTWLADAMEGPTPVSALIHAATMVTAGVYLFIRISPILEYVSNSLIIIVWLGGLTALFGASCGIFESDLKKVIAYSTSSQLGYMLVSCGISQYHIALFHLINHAFFKALLFLSAGAIIHTILDEQDMRKYGALNIFLPFTYLNFLIGSLSIMAFPFFTGFYSKDLLLELLFIPYNLTNTIGFFLTLFAAYLTSFYSIRLLILTFINRSNLSSKNILSYILDPDPTIFICLFILQLGAVYFGYLTQEFFLFPVVNNHDIFILPDHFIHFHFLNIDKSSLSLVFLIPFTLICLLFLYPGIRKSKNINIYQSNKIQSNNLVKYTKILIHWNTCYNWFILFYMKFSIYFSRLFDRGILQFIGPIGIYKLLDHLAIRFESNSTNYLLHYFSIILIMCIIMIFTSYYY